MKKWNVPLEQLKQPAVIIGALAVLCAGIIVLTVMLVVQPDLQRSSALRDQRAAAEQDLQTAMRRPVPEAISQERIDELLKQVPTEERIEEFLLQLIEYERNAGAEVLEIRIGGSFSDEGDEQEGRSAVGETEEAARLFSGSTDIHMRIEGTYQELYSFFNQLYDADRTIYVPAWSMNLIDTELGARVLEAFGASGTMSPIFRLDMHVVLFYAPEYMSAFPMDPLEAEQPTLPRSNPANFEPDTTEMLLDYLTEQAVKEQASQEGGN